MNLYEYLRIDTLYPNRQVVGLDAKPMTILEGGEKYSAGTFFSAVIIAFGSAHFSGT